MRFSGRSLSLDRGRYGVGVQIFPGHIGLSAWRPHLYREPHGLRWVWGRLWGWVSWNLPPRRRPAA